MTAAPALYRHEILVAEQQLVVASADASAGGTAAVSLLQPANFTHAGSWARSATFTLTVAAVNGAPTGWHLGVKFQMCQLHAGASKFRYQQRRWYDLTSDQIETCIVEGVAWGSPGHIPPPDGSFGNIADQGTTLPLTVRRTIRDFGPDIRLVLDPQFTGGTNPSLGLTLTRELRSH